MSTYPDSSDEEHSDREVEEDDEAEEEEEEEEKEEKRRKVAVTSMDEALRAVCEPLDHRSHKDFLKQNFETLGDNSNMGDLGGATRLSMSSRFLAQGHRHRRVTARRRGAAGPAPQPPVSKVRPMLEGAAERQKTPGTAAASAADAAARERDSQQHPGPQRKTAPARAHQWRLSNPTLKAPPLVEVSAGLHKSRSVQNLLRRAPLRPLVSERRHCGSRRTGTPRGSPCPPSSPLSGSAPSSHSPLPWESPRPRSPRSYMIPTTSFMAKCSSRRTSSSSSSSSFPGEELQTRSPPRSPPRFSKRRRGSSDAEMLRSFSSCSSCSSSSSTSSSSSSPSLEYTSSLPAVPASPSRGFTFSLKVPPPSRIPMPRQTMSPRRSLCLDLKAGADWPVGPLRSPTSAAAPLSQAPPAAPPRRQ
ncbi:hypothetical protein N1851_030676 [Merluccius polli]|uniref:Uncharacterized protein n=1 Tax=Merluccius polli TaxID=89951 RepID=A0AA47M548_MERPO|nr:hypothetical protein N1851_030676 [Merluccius polli]